ncbi:hypothetical protein D3C71_2138820 [compost metagenome]
MASAITLIFLGTACTVVSPGIRTTFTPLSSNCLSTNAGSANSVVRIRVGFSARIPSAFSWRI